MNGCIKKWLSHSKGLEKSRVYGSHKNQNKVGLYRMQTIYKLTVEQTIFTNERGYFCITIRHIPLRIINSSGYIFCHFCGIGRLGNGKSVFSTKHTSTKFLLRYFLQCSYSL